MTSENSTIFRMGTRRSLRGVGKSVHLKGATLGELDSYDSLGQTISTASSGASIPLWDPQIDRTISNDWSYCVGRSQAGPKYGMRTAQIERSPTLLIGDVEPNAFNPAMASRSVHVRVLIDVSGLRVVPVIASITASTANERDALMRHAIIKADSHPVPAFGRIRSLALIEPSSRGHILTPWGDGHPGRSRQITWLGEVTLTFLQTGEVCTESPPPLVSVNMADHWRSSLIHVRPLLP
jgi:hypothetical protein